ncbi:hypothetical protein V8E54_000267 [Elaphomyces granulatus]
MFYAASWHSEGRSTSTDCGGIPDIVTIPANCSEAIIVGELKIPWMHDLQMNIVKPAIEQSIWGKLVNICFMPKSKIPPQETAPERLFSKVTVRECFMLLGLELLDGN